MAITFGTPEKYSGTTTTRTITCPSDFADGDTWLVLFAKDDQVVVDVPGISGWNEVYAIGDTTYDDSFQAAYWEYFATDPGGTVSITGGDAEEWCVISVAVKTAGGTISISGAAAASLKTTENATAPATQEPAAGGATDDVTISVVSTRSDGGCLDMSPPIGMSMLAQYEQGTGNGDSQIAAAYEAWVNDDPHTFTGANGDRDWVGNTFVIKEEAGITEETGTPTDGLVFDDGVPAVIEGGVGAPVDAIVFDESGVVTTYEIWGGSGVVFDDGIPVGSEGITEETGTPTDALVFDDGAPVGLGGELALVTSAMTLDDGTPDAKQAVLEAITSALTLDDGVPIGIGGELASILSALTFDDGVPLAAIPASATTALVFGGGAPVSVVAILGPVADGVLFGEVPVGVGGELGPLTTGLVFDDGVPASLAAALGPITTAITFDDGVPVGEEEGITEATGTPTDGLVFDESGLVTTYEIWSGTGIVFEDEVVPSTGQTDATGTTQDGVWFDEDITTIEEVNFDDENVLIGDSAIGAEALQVISGLVFDDGVPVAGIEAQVSVQSATIFDDGTPVGSGAVLIQSDVLFSDDGVAAVVGGVTPTTGMLFGDAVTPQVALPIILVSATDFGASVEVVTGVAVSDGLTFGGSAAATVSDVAEVLGGMLFGDSVAATDGVIVSVSTGFSLGATITLLDELRRRYSFGTIGAETRTSLMVVRGNERYTIGTIGAETRTESVELP